MNNLENVIAIDLEDTLHKKQPKSKNSKFKSLLNIFKKKSKIVAIIRLQGVISSNGGKFSNHISLENLTKSIKDAFAISNLQAVVLQIDCPGGSPVQSELIYRYIRMMADEKNIPVMSFAEDVAASGGYWLLCAGDEIYASKSSIIGSIGVISSGFGMHEAIKKIGIERRIYTQGENKSVLDPFKPENPNDIEIIYSIQKDIHESFKELVIERRAGKLNDANDKIFSGEFWSGKKALELGLIDHIGDMHSVLREKYGDDIKIKKVNSEKNWFKRKFSIDSLISKIMLVYEEKLLRNRVGL